MFGLVKAVDKANGYIFCSKDGRDTMISTAIGADFDFLKYAYPCSIHNIALYLSL